MDNLIMRKYQCDYNLKDKQYFLIKNYFDTYSSDDELIDRNLFQNHLIKYSEKARIELKANENDIKNSLEVIDSDSNYFIDFNEFLDFLTLFFASKPNLKDKIISVLNGHQYSHSSAGYLNVDEAKSNFEFLAKFYNIKNENKNSFFTINQEEFISYSDFADLVYPYLEPYLYVKF
jgi:Ca2+-binding EF-hand superfamily protein